MKKYLYFVLTLLTCIFVSVTQLTSQAQYEPYWGIAKCPSNNDVRVLSIDSMNYLYAGVWGDGIYRSQNDAASWTQINNGLTNLFVTCIAISPDGRIYAGTQGSGIFLSTNKGNNWTQLNNGITDLNIKAITFYKNGNIVAGTYGGGVFRSLDTGKSFQAINTHLSFRDINCITLAKDSIIIVGTNGGGIFRSSDNGTTWVQVGSSLKSMTINAFATANDGSIYAATTGAGVYISYQDGTGWVPYYNSYLRSPTNARCIALKSRENPIIGKSDSGVVVFDINYLGLPGDTPWRSTNNFYYGINGIVINSSGTIFICQPYDGIKKSTNGGTSFITENFGFSASSGIKPLFSVQGSILLTSRLQGGIWRSSDNGDNWSVVALNNNNVNNYCTDASGNVYAATELGPYKSTDLGVTWSHVGSWNNKIYAIAVKDDGTMFITDSTVRRSTNNGTSWTAVGDMESMIYQFLVLGPSGELFCNQVKKVNMGDPPGQNGFKVSYNNGTTWTRLIDDASALVNSFKIINGKWMAATSRGLWTSTDNGTTWTSNLCGLPYADMTDFVITPTGNIIIVANFGLHLMHSNDGGTTWKSIFSGLTKGAVEKMIVNGVGDILLSSLSIFRSRECEDLIIPNLVTPAADVIVYDLKPKLDWDPVNYADLYEMQIAKDIDFTEIVESCVLSATEWDIVRDLDYNTNYWWRVRSKKNVNTSTWTTVRKFTTTLRKPVLLFPPDSSIANPTTLNFAWDRVSGANRYQLQVSEDEYFNKLTVNKDSINDTTFKVSTLKNSSSYWWRVRAKSNVSTSQWSDEWVFATKLAAPLLKYPVNKQSGVFTDVKMLWDSVQFAKRYELRIATDSLFKTTVYLGKSDDDTSYTPTSLEVDKKYFWQVRAIAGKDTSDWSVAWSFTTNLGPAILISPANNSVNMPLTDTLVWDAPKSSTKYHLQVAKDVNFTNLIVDDSTLTLRKYVVSNLETNTTYYWRAKFYINNNSGIWSLPWKFTTNIGNVTLVSPADSSINQQASLDLVWSGPQYADKYNVQLATDADFNNLVVNDTLKAMKLTVYNLKHNRQYRWRVRMFTGNTVSEFVPFWVFNTCVDTVVLSNPANNLDNLDPKITFKWNKAEGAEFYHIQIAEDKLFTKIAHQKDSIVGLEYAYNDLDTSKIYYWRVKAKFKKLEAVWSDVWRFATRGERVGVDDPNAFESGNVIAYPNPFNNFITIKYKLTESAKVTLRIIDLSGFVTSIPVDSWQNSGVYEVKFNPEQFGLSQGTYLYYITIGDRSKAGEIIYMK